MSRNKGWINYDKFQSRRHGLSALGISTGRKAVPKKSKVNFLVENAMFFPKSQVKIVEKGNLEYGKILTVRRVPYGKDSTAKKDREYRIEGIGGSPVGNIGEFSKFAKEHGFKSVKFIEKDGSSEVKELGYTPKYKASDVGAVSTDIVVGTGAETTKYAPLIAGIKVRQWARKKLKKGKKKKSKKSDLFYPKSKKESKLKKIADELVALTKPQKSKSNFFEEALGRTSVAIGKGEKKKLHYPKQMKSNYPIVTKEITRLSKKHNIKKPKLISGKNPRLATFIPPNTVKLSKRLKKESKAKRRNVAQHEFKHLSDVQKTSITDVAELEKRAVHFEKKTK